MSCTDHGTCFCSVDAGLYTDYTVLYKAVYGIRVRENQWRGLPESMPMLAHGVGMITGKLRSYLIGMPSFKDTIRISAVLS